MSVGKLDGLECDHRTHGCTDYSFAWVHHTKKFIWLENPKVCSSFIKVDIMGSGACPDVTAALESRDQIAHYPDFKVFGIYRDPRDKILSAYKDFIRSDKQMRFAQLRSLFELEEFPQSVVSLALSAVSFSQFLDLAIEYKDHHWAPNYPYLFLPDRHVTLFNYHEEVMSEVESFLDVRSNRPPRTVSALYIHSITPEEDEKIFHIMRMDYENMEYFRERIINDQG